MIDIRLGRHKVEIDGKWRVRWCAMMVAGGASLTLIEGVTQDKARAVAYQYRKAFARTDLLDRLRWMRDIKGAIEEVFQRHSPSGVKP